METKMSKSQNRGTSRRKGRYQTKPRTPNGASLWLVEAIERRVLMSAGDLDFSFGVDGFVLLPGSTGFETVIARPDGKVLAVRLVSPSGAGGVLIDQFDADGSPDTSFGGGDGQVTLDFAEGTEQHVVAFAAPGGKFVVATNVTLSDGTSRVGLARFHPGGTPDGTFATAGRRIIGPPAGATGVTMADIAVDTSGRVVFAGEAIYSDDTHLPTVVRRTSAGTPDNSFGTGGVWVDATGKGHELSSITIAPDGKVVVAGQARFLDDPNYGQGLVERLTTSGALDTSFDIDGQATWLPGGAFTSRFADVVVQSDGKVLGLSSIVQGSYDPPLQQQAPIRFNVNGTIDQTYPYGFYDTPVSLVSYDERFTAVGRGDWRFFGPSVTGYGPGAFAENYWYGGEPPEAAAATIASDGKLVVAGRYFGSPILFRIQNQVSDENDAIPEAPLVEPSVATVGVTPAGAIDFPTDVDLYKIVVSAGQRLSFDVDRTAGSSLDSYLRVFNSTGTRIAWNDDGAAPDEGASKSAYIEYTFDAAGTYFIGVSGKGNNTYSATTGDGDSPGSTGGYTFDVRIVSPAQADYDDQVAEAMLVDVGVGRPGTVSGAISPGTDVDLYAFDVEQGQTVTFDVDLPAGSSLDSYLRIFNADGYRFTYNDNGAAPGETLGRSSYLSYTFESGGRYYVGVSGAGNRSYNPVTGLGDVVGGGGAYTLRIEPLTPPDNDQFDEAQGLRGSDGGDIIYPVTDSIAWPTDVNVYVLDNIQGDTLAFDIDLPPGSTLDPYLRVYDADGNLLGSNDNAAAPGEAPSLASFLQITEGSPHYVVVSSAANRNSDPVTGGNDTPGSMGEYRLTIISAVIESPDPA
jgi:uncharacterized delta-60 repeat protein